MTATTVEVDYSDGAEGGFAVNAKVVFGERKDLWRLSSKACRWTASLHHAEYSG